MSPRAGLWLWLLVPLSAAADENLLGCRAIGDASERLACYDRVVDRVKTEIAPEAPAAAEPRASSSSEPRARAETAAAPDDERSWRERWFGSSEAATERALRKSYGAPEAPEQLTAKVAETERGADRTLVITLENGQVWRQAELRPFVLRPGDTVEIDAGVLDSYYLRRVGQAREIRVKRVR